MSKPLQPEEQCPSCHLQSLGPICGGQKRRINKNEKDEYFKAIDCQLWIERKIEVTATGERRCPTCGQVIQSEPESKPEPMDAWEAEDQTPPPQPPGSDIFDWGDSILEQQGVPALQVQENERARSAVDAVTPDQSAKEPKPRKRRASEIPKAKYRKKGVLNA